VTDEFLRQFLIVALETLQENQLTIARLANKVAAFEECVRMINPELARAYDERAAQYRKRDVRFDNDVELVVQRFGNLIQKLKHGDPH